MTIASYGARVRESVFRIKFRVLAVEFESIETSPGFARLEFKDIKNQQCVDKDVKYQKSRTEHCDFTKKFDASIFVKKNVSKHK